MSGKSIFKVMVLAMAGVTGCYFTLHQLLGNQHDLTTNILNNADQVVPAFNGLVMPVEKMPDWVAIGPEKWDTPYQKISAQDLIPVPAYDAAILKIPRKNLDPKKASDRAALNAKSFYLATYLGNYQYRNLEFDGQEEVGSHTGIDMRLPKGTPVRAIGNGRVVEVAFDTIGFGTHLVLEHPNFPSLDDPAKKTTYYSSYNHLDAIVVKEGDIVLKGQLVGRSGQTGYASLPHLHFQIDTDKAPWHPYWPFTLKEADAAGYSYAEAVNNGLGKAKAKITTIHPLLYLQKYQRATLTPHASAPEMLAMVEAPALPSSEWKTVSSSLSTLILQRPFRDIPLRGELNTALQFLKTYKVVNGYSDGTFQPARTVSRAEAPKLILASIHSSTQAQTRAPFKDVAVKSWYTPAVATAKTLGIVQGYADGTYRPSVNVSRAEFLAMLLKAWKVPLPTPKGNLVFKDIRSSHWAAPYVQYAKNAGLIDGKITVFRPDQGITRGEAAVFMYRMLHLSLSGKQQYTPNTLASEDSLQKFFQ